MTEIAMSKVDEAYALLEEQIIMMELKPGQLLSESELTQSLGLGRTPIREALQKLATQKLIEIMPRRGMRVTDIDIAAQVRLLEVRRVLEQLQAKLAALRANDIQRTHFSGVADAMELSAKEGDYLSFLRLDNEFNHLMSSACHNEFVEPMLAQLHGLSRRFWHRHLENNHDLVEGARLHAQVARAIAKGNVIFAEGAAKEHMNYIAQLTRKALDESL